MKTAEIFRLGVLALVAGFFLCWKVAVVPPDLDGETANTAQAAYLVGQARATGTPFSEVVERAGVGASPRGNQDAPAYHSYLRMEGRTLPLWMLILQPFLALFGTTHFAVSVASTVIGLGVVAATYFAARSMLGPAIAVLAALLQACSLFFVLDARSSFHSIPTLIALLAVYAFHRSLTKRHFLWTFGVLMGLGWLNGYPPWVIIPGILVVALWWVAGDRSFWRRGYFWTTIAVALLTCLTLSMLYSRMFHLDSVFQAFYELNRQWLFARTSQVGVAGHGFSFLIPNVLNALRNYFVGMTYDTASHTYLVVPRLPMIDPFVAICLVVGTVAFIRERTPAQKLVLVWAALGFLLFSCLAEFQVRYQLVFAPALYMLAAGGIVSIVAAARRARIPSAAAVAIVAAGMATSAAMTYCGYFRVYAASDAYLWRFTGNEQIARYIASQAPPADCQVVFGHHVLVPADNFLFYTRDAYPIMRWSQISEEDDVNKYWEYERNVLRGGKKTIFYVFSLDNARADTPGKRIWGDYEDLTRFEKIHPDLVAAKVISYTSGLPAFAIYKVTTAPTADYRYALGTSAHSSAFQVFVADHPVLDGVRFQVTYAGNEDLLSPLIVELRRTVGTPASPDLSPGAVMTSVVASPHQLRLEREMTSFVRFPYTVLDVGATYAVVWKVSHISDRDHYVLAGPTLKTERDGPNLIPVPGAYTFETTAANDRHVLAVPERRPGGVSFRIVFGQTSWRQAAFADSNVQYTEAEAGNWRWLAPVHEGEAYLLYKVESRAIIDRIEVTSNPRIQNDAGRRNFVRLSFSTDGHKYVNVYRLESSKTESWTGIYEKEMVNTIAAESNVVYLRFDLGSPGTQLWATESHPLVVKVTSQGH